MHGIHYNLDERTYRQDLAISQSALKAIGRSPAHFRAGIEEDKDETRAMILGRVAGQLVMEPDRESWWTIKPEKIGLNTTEGKEWAKEITKWKEDVDGKFPRSANEAFDKKGITVISFEEFKRASEMAGVLADSGKPEIRELLDNSDFEVSGFADVETPSGIVACKFRADIVPRGSTVIADIKTCQFATPDEFLKKSVVRLGYHVQAGSYLKLWNIAAPNDQRYHFRIIAIESKPPYATQVFHFDSEFIRHGASEYERLLATYAFCKHHNDWPDYAPGIQTLTLPEWMQNRIN